MTTADRRTLRSRRTSLLVGGAIIALVIGYLIVSSARGATVLAFTIQDLQARPSQFYDRQVRVGGTVTGDSIQWDTQQMLLRFNLLDGEYILPVVHSGVRPDMLRDGAQAVVEGRYQRDGVFLATKLLLNCPSKYEAAATQTATQLVVD